MKTQPAFIWADGTVKLYTVSGIYLHLPLIVNPGNTELKLPLRLYQPLKESVPPVFFFIRFNHCSEGFQYFLHCLVEFRLGRILRYYPFQDFINI